MKEEFSVRSQILIFFVGEYSPQYKGVVESRIVVVIITYQLI